MLFTELSWDCFNSVHAEFGMTPSHSTKLQKNTSQVAGYAEA
jgi:hypothetical protein